MDRSSSTSASEGAPEIPSGTGLAEGIARLRSAMASFEAHRGDLPPHFAYGPVARDDYERVHAMHVANHLQALEIDG